MAKLLLRKVLVVDARLLHHVANVLLKIVNAAAHVVNLADDRLAHQLELILLHRQSERHTQRMESQSVC